MIEDAQDWLAEQRAQDRDLLLVVDRLAEPDPVIALFGADLMQDYVNLYQDTEFADLAEVGPWLVRLNNPDAALIQKLLNEPERNWGWLASATHVDLGVMTQHWRERMLIDEEGQRALYRFQDNRVMARHLGALSETQRPLLLGPLTSALCWDGHVWQSIQNLRPERYPAPFDKPWQNIAEPEAINQDIQRHNLELWLWQNHSAATAQLAEGQPLHRWLDEQLAKARDWQWQSMERIQFLLRHQLNPELATHSAWTPHTYETPDTHFTRSSQALLSASDAARSNQG